MYLVTFDFNGNLEMRARDRAELIDWFRENGQSDLINWQELDENGSTQTSCYTWKIQRDPGYGFDATLITLFEIFDDSDPMQIYEEDPTEDHNPDQLKLF